MSSSSGQTPNFTLNPHSSSATEKKLIAFNITAQINEKLTLSTFPQWRAQFEAVLIGYDLIDYVEATFLCPSSTCAVADLLHKNHWIRQDKLILSALLASTSPSITPPISMAKTSHEAWKNLKTLYASRSRTPAPIRARENSMVFEELHDLLVGHEYYLRRLETATQQVVMTRSHKMNVNHRSHSHNSACQSNGYQRDLRHANNGFSKTSNNHKHYNLGCQFYEQMGYTAKSCPRIHQMDLKLIAQLLPMEKKNHGFWTWQRLII
ncbi:hypothetical protein MIMGU_mgv1a021540mg [Erythranthe guttata]|uniref:Retrotransposon Copia-like N-terminal domain-containing protein n=1 Tax=Erythranthe guttata TaxID=4155 RepID=A0A022PU16_ERYGU|nr:hypothetical protein MIMGU_mgv1a021540mg [Erythranthe guttata]